MVCDSENRDSDYYPANGGAIYHGDGVSGFANTNGGKVGG
jgi:hypothetical protein